MKRTLFAIGSVAMVATAVGMEAANAQYAPAPPAYTPPPAYGPGPYPDAVIVNPVTGRWCRTEANGYQFCWTP